MSQHDQHQKKGEHKKPGHEGKSWENEPHERKGQEKHGVQDRDHMHEKHHGGERSGH